MGHEHEEDRYCCPCGKGAVVRHSSRHDGPFSLPTFWGGFECPSCEADYQLSVSHREGSIALVRRSEYEEYRRLEDKANAKLGPCLKALGQEVIDPLRAVITARARAAGRTYDAWFAALKEPMGLTFESVAAFRSAAKKCGGLDGWLSREINTQSVEALCRAFGVDLPFAEHLSNLAACNAERGRYPARLPLGPPRG